MFLATAREIELGATVLVVLALPDGGLPVEVPARVVRMVRAGDPGGGKPGLGVQFVGDKVPALSRRIQKLIDSVRQP